MHTHTQPPPFSLQTDMHVATSPLSSRHTERHVIFSSCFTIRLLLQNFKKTYFASIFCKGKKRDNEHSVFRNKSPSTVRLAGNRLSSRGLLRSQPGLCCRLNFQFSPSVMEKEKSLSKAVIVCFWGERTNY